jgi:GT2 family glycosyltransferase
MSGDAVTIVIPVWNGRALLLTLLEKLRAQTYPIAEVIAVDNGSEDGAAEAAEGQGATVLRLGSNRGFAAAVNHGIEASRTGLVALVNSDVEPDADWLERLVSAFGPSEVWFAAGKILSAAQRDRIDGTYDLLSRAGCAWRAGHDRPDGPGYSRPRPIAMAPATAALFRTELFQRVGKFDEAFESYLEDVDFGLRCALAGCGGVYVPGAIAYHWGSAALGAWSPEVVRRIARNQVYVVVKHFPWRYWWPILVGQILWGLMALRHGTGWAFVHGKAEGIQRALSGSRQRKPEARISEIVEQSERQIREAQHDRSDLYWTVYFLLTCRTD